MRRVLGIIVFVTAPWVSLAGQGAVPNRSQDIFFGPDVLDARALWVNPAALGIVPSASVMAELTLLRPFADESRVGQWTLGLSSRGFSFGYQHDELGNDQSRDTYRFGFGGGLPPLSVGASVAMHRGVGKGLSWDIGAVYQASRYLSLSGVLANIGQPDLGPTKEDELPFTIRPAATLTVGSGIVVLSGGASITSDSLTSVGAGVQLRPLPGVPFTALARIDAIGKSLNAGRITFAVSWGVRGIIQGALSAPEDLGRTDVASLTGVAIQPIGGPRRF